LSYVLGTTDTVVRFYKIGQPLGTASVNVELLDRLDTSEVTTFGNKESAKEAAIGIGLKTWRYIKI
jgi:hypothetical protein